MYCSFVIVEALYKDTHPDYASYLYLMAPISLAILNPISFVLMEIGKRQAIANSDLSINNDSSSDSVSRSRSQWRVVASVAKNIFLNPIILMTILGILGNLVFKHTVPVYLKGILEVNSVIV